MKNILILFLAVLNLCSSSCISYNNPNTMDYMISKEISVSINQNKWIWDDRWKYREYFAHTVFESAINVRPSWDSSILQAFQEIFPDKKVNLVENDSDFMFSIDTHISTSGQVYVLCRVQINKTKINNYRMLGNVIGYFKIETSYTLRKRQLLPIFPNELRRDILSVF